MGTASGPASSPEGKSDDRSSVPSDKRTHGEIRKPSRGLSVDLSSPAFSGERGPLPVSLPLRPEFRPGAPERGEADEPDVASLRDDWSGGVEVRVSIVRREFRQLQRIHVVAEVKNVSGRHLWLPPCAGNPYLSTRVRVFDAKGKLVPMTQFYKNEGRGPGVIGMSSGAAGLAFNPKQSLSVDIIANLIYDMTRPGEYWVLFEMPVGPLYTPRPGQEGIFYARAAPIKVKIIPDPVAILRNGTAVPDPDRP
jgi:hypothetical protein